MNFLANDRTPYTYCITHKITKKSYYGRNASKGCHPNDFWNTYFTTSDIIKQIIKQEGKDIFVTKIMRIFDSVKQCQEHEIKFLTRIHAASNPKMYNRHNGSTKFYNMNGFPHSQDSKTKISIANKGKPKSAEHKAKLSISRIGKITSLITRSKMSQQRKGKIWIHNDSIYKIIKPSELSIYESNGFVKGKPPLSEQSCAKISKANTGRKPSLETLKKMSNSLKGKKSWNKGLHHSESTKEKLSRLFKGKLMHPRTTEMNEKTSKTVSNLIWINNGIIQKRIPLSDWDKYKQLGFMLGRGWINHNRTM
jgi:hypothetical protein